MTDAQRKALLAGGYNPDDYDAQLTPTAVSSTKFPEQSLGTPMPKANGPIQTAVESAASGAIPTAASGAGFGAGMVGGTSIAALLEGAGLLADSTGVGALLGIPLGVTGAYLMGKTALKAQNKIVPQATQQQVAADQQANPKSAIAGNLLDLPLGGMSPSAPNAIRALGTLGKLPGAIGENAGLIAPAEIANLRNVGIGAALNPAIDSATAAVTGQPQPGVGNLAKSAAIGALFNKPNSIGTKYFGFHPAPVDPRFDPNVNRAALPDSSDPSQVIPPAVPNTIPQMGTGAVDPIRPAVETQTPKLADLPALQALAKLPAPENATSSPGAIDKAVGVQPNSQTADQADQTGQIADSIRQKQNLQQGQEQVSNNPDTQSAGKPEQNVPTPDKVNKPNAKIDLENQINETQKMLDTPGLPTSTKIAAQETLNNLRQKVSTMDVLPTPDVQPEPLIKPVVGVTKGDTSEPIGNISSKTTTGFLSSKVPAETSVEKAMSGTSKHQEADATKNQATDEQPKIFPKNPDLNNKTVVGRLMAIAAKHGVKLTKDKTLPPNIAGQIFKNGATDAVARLSPTAAGLDTPHHEIIHALFSYMENSKQAALKAFAAKGKALFGGEEPFVQASGEKGMDRFAQKPGAMNAIKEYYNDFKDFWKYRLGKATPEDMANIMSYWEVHGEKGNNEIGGGLTKTQTGEDTAKNSMVYGNLSDADKQSYSKLHSDAFNARQDYNKLPTGDSASKLIDSENAIKDFENKQSPERNQDAKNTIKVLSKEVPLQSDKSLYDELTRRGKGILTDIRDSNDPATRAKLFTDFHENQQRIEDIKNKQPEKGMPPTKNQDADKVKSDDNKLPYGYWIDKEGNFSPVRFENHREEAVKILKQKYGIDESIEFASNRLQAERGYTRAILHKPSETLELDENRVPLSSKARKSIKDFAIENNINAKQYRNRGYGRDDIIHSKDDKFQDASKVKEQPSDVSLGMSDKNKFSGKKTGEQDTPYLTAPVVRPLLDTIRRSADEQGNKLADAVEQFYIKERSNRGQFDPAIKAVSKLNPTEREELYKTFISERREQTPYRDDLSSDKLKTSYDTIREVLKKKQEDQIAANEPVIDYRDKKPFARPARIDPYYFPNAPSAKALDVLLNHPETSDAATLRKDFLQHQLDHGAGLDEATERLKAQMSAFGGGENSKGSNQTRFGANRIAEGSGLPDSWIEPDLGKAMERYSRRAGKDRAWYDAVESNPDLSKMLGAKKDAWLKPIDSEATDISSMQPVKTLMENIKGTHEASEINANAVAKVATSAMLGPLTAVHIATTSPFGQATFAQLHELPELAKTYLTKSFEGIQHAFATGYAHRDVTFGREFLDANTNFAEKANALSRLITKISGREHLDYFTKGMLQAGGEFLVEKNIARARNGDQQGIDFLQNLDKTFDYEKDYTPQKLQELGSSLASYTHGDYNAKTMPAWMMKDGFVAPFFKLASWNIGQTNHFMRNVLTPATKGNFTPLIMNTLGAVAGGALVKYLREQVAGKKSNIPTLDEISNSPGGLEGHKSLTAYNLMAMASYAGYMGMISQLAKTGFDAAYKNKPQGAMFPLDEAVSNVGTTLSQGYESLFNGDGDYARVVPKMLLDLLKDNIQLSRLAVTHVAKNTNLMPEEKDRLEISQKNRDLRAYKMIEGQPYDSQEVNNSNPYLEPDIKEFKRTQDMNKAVDLLPTVIQRAQDKAKGDPFVFKKELQGLKENPYDTMPNLEQSPLQTMRYIDFIRHTQGDDAAQKLLLDYYQRNTINKMKGELVPSL